MPQFARPASDLVIGNFTTQAGGATSLFATIDEVTADDADYIRSPASPVNEPYSCNLSSITDPVSSAGHIMRMRTATDLAAQEAIDFTQQLRQGMVSEASLGTLIASQSRLGVTSTTWTTSAYTLSAAEADAITSYGDLDYRFLVHRP